tara:strand:- start:23473 stop:23859 length:387 start_codon:yes stop_codon:yes gene_type:complete
MNKKKKKSEGIGDTISKITKATGIKKLVEFIAGEDCGCSERQTYLNEKFPYKRNKPSCLLEKEYNWLTEYFNDPKKFSYVVVKTQVGTIHARVFGHHYKKICSCKSSPLLRYVGELKIIYDAYKEESK